MTQQGQLSPTRRSSARRIIRAISSGWQSAKANVIPGMAIVAFAALLVAAYYRIPEVSTSLEDLVKIRQQLGFWFAMAASAVGAGIIPGIYLTIAGRTRKGPRAGIDLLFTCLVWAITAFALDRFYLFQAWLWGPTVSLPILLGKMAVDQLLFSPFIGVQLPAVGFRFRDLNYNFRKLWREIREDWVIGITIPLLIACWLTWIPGSLVVYSLPLPLQIPMMVLIQCFFSLEVAYASSKMETTTPPNH
jgi:hypothetical protein